MRIAFLHNALGKTDGVSLEVDKWKSVLSEMGHEVFYIAGNENDTNIVIPELDFYHSQTKKEIKNATVELTDYRDQEALLEDIRHSANLIKSKLYDIIEDKKIDVIIPNNLMSVGYHIAVLKAIYELIEETGIKTICHNHDFYFEDSKEVTQTCRGIKDILEEMAPPKLPNVKNLVINKIAKRELFNRKHINADIVPNVFDFDMKPWERDEYNAGFLKDFNIKEDDLVFLQATRVMDRKGIELAIDVVGDLNKKKQSLIGKTLYNGKKFTDNSSIILLCAGIVENFGISGEYVNGLTRRAKEKQVDLRFIGERVSHSRGMKGGEKIYSLWDSYVYSDFVTYPSIWEGFGNQFIEAVFAKLPIVAFEYPVYISDLKEKGFETVSLGDKYFKKDVLIYIDEDIIKRAGDKIVEILLDRSRADIMTGKNYNIAKENYSYKVLKNIIKELNL